jgi:hypothetical protein
MRVVAVVRAVVRAAAAIHQMWVPWCIIGTIQYLGTVRARLHLDGGVRLHDPKRKQAFGSSEALRRPEGRTTERAEPAHDCLRYVK